MKRPASIARLAFVLCSLALVACGSRFRESEWPTTAPTTTAAVVDAEPKSADWPSAPVPGAERVIATLRPQFRACYERGRRDENHLMKGSLVMMARVAADGSVQAAKVGELEGLSHRVASCIAEELLKTSFPPPGGGGGAVEVPVRFLASAS